MPSDPTKPATFTLQSVFAVKGQGVMMGVVNDGEIIPGMTTIIKGKKRTVIKIEGMQSEEIHNAVIGISLSNTTAEELQEIGTIELLFSPKS